VVSAPIIYSLIQDSDDEDGEDGAGNHGDSGRRLEFGGRTSPPVQEDQSEPEMTEEEKEFQLVCSHKALSFDSPVHSGHLCFSPLLFASYRC